MTMNLRSFFFKIAKILAVLAFVWIATGFIFQWWFWRSETVDYSTQSPSKIFRKVMNQDMPAGVSNLGVAGRGVLIDHTVWMRYSATDSAMNILLTNQRLYLDGPYRSMIWLTKKQVLQDMDARSLGWSEVLNSKHLEFYSYSSVSTGSGWIGEVVLDRRNHRIYTYSSAI